LTTGAYLSEILKGLYDLFESSPSPLESRRWPEGPARDNGVGTFVLLTGT
jgi:hypothetical protein